MQRNLDAVGKLRDHALLIQRNRFHALIGKILRQKTAPRSECIQRVRNRQANFLYADFQNVAGFGAFDVNRPGQHVCSRAMIFHLFVNFSPRGLDTFRP